MDNDTKKFISQEITRQLRELKEQINRETYEEMKVLRKDIMARVISYVEDKVIPGVKSTTKKSLDEAKQDMEIMTKNMTSANTANINSIVLANNKQLREVKETTREIVLAVGEQVQTAVYGRVISEINEKIIPKVENMIQWVNYSTQDGAEVVDQYRREVEYNQGGGGRSQQLLTHDGDNRHIISDNVRLFFKE